MKALIYLSAFIIIGSFPTANASNFQFFTGNNRLEAQRSPRLLD
ncbi:MAG: hypothetical protein AAFV71_13420 [Cyanobacteria bacterium J06633_8]